MCFAAAAGATHDLSCGLQSYLHASFIDIAVECSVCVYRLHVISTFVGLFRYNKPLLPKYEAAERNVQLKQEAIEKKIAGRRINQVRLAFLCIEHP